MGVCTSSYKLVMTGRLLLGSGKVGQDSLHESLDDVPLVGVRPSMVCAGFSNARYGVRGLVDAVLRQRLTHQAGDCIVGVDRPTADAREGAAGIAYDITIHVKRDRHRCRREVSNSALEL